MDMMGMDVYGWDDVKSTNGAKNPCKMKLRYSWTNFFLTSGTMASGVPRWRPSGRYSNTSHFVKWDNRTTGGRWFECMLGETTTTNKRKAICHDGEEAYFHKHDLALLGGNASKNDEVLAYWDGKGYACLGKITTEEKSGEVWVEFADGDKGWIPLKDVHKLQRLR